MAINFSHPQKDPFSIDLPHLEHATAHLSGAGEWWGIDGPTTRYYLKDMTANRLVTHKHMEYTE